MTKKVHLLTSVLDEARERIAKSFDMFERLYISFSGGKDSSVMFHLVMDEAKKRDRKVGVLIIDLEAQYSDTIKTISLAGFAGMKTRKISGYARSQHWHRI